jgi:hypothetical protein
LGPGGQVGQECGVHGPLSTRLPAKRPRVSRNQTARQSPQRIGLYGDLPTRPLPPGAGNRA